MCLAAPLILNITFKVWKCLITESHSEIGELQQCIKEIGNLLPRFFKQSAQFIQIVSSWKSYSQNT